MHIRRDKIRNGDIMEMLGVVFTADKMREARLRWFRHVKRRCVDASLMREVGSDSIRIDRGKLK